MGGAIPGNYLLERHRLRYSRLLSRIQRSQSSVSAAVSGGAVLPGIQLRPSVPAGELPTTVASGDFNGDGHMDFVVANALTNDLWLYLGSGNGTFQLPRVIPLSKGLSPVDVVAADLAGNGKLDLVIAESDSSTIGVLLGNGDGTFGYETTYDLPEPPESLVVDDFNRDGKPDVAAVMVTTLTTASSHIPYIALLTGDGTGKFTGPTITNNWGFESSAWNIASGDVNNDGLPDVLVTGPGIESSQVFLNNGDGTFTAGAIAVQNDPDTGLPLVLDGRLADVNGDGCLDAVVADVNSMVWVAPGDCTGQFSTPVPVMMGDSNAAVRLVDVNGDGHLDIVTSALPALSALLGFVSGNTLSVALGDGKGNFGTARNYIGTGQAYSIATADFNGDGHPDFATANNNTDTVSVFQNDGSGGFGFPQGIYAGVPNQLVINAPATSLSFADLNGDSRTDAFFLDFGYNGEYYATAFLNDGTGKFNGPISSDTGFSSEITDYRLGNFRNTGHLDLVAIGGPDNNEILFAPGNGDGTFGKGTIATVAGAGGSLATGDFNRDGKLDFVAISGMQNPVLTAFLGNGDGTFRSGFSLTISDPNEGAWRVYSGDFNSDGKLDILAFTTGNGYWTTTANVWEFNGNGDGTFQAGRQLFTGFQPFALADVNGDGRPDIARYDFMWPGSTQIMGPAIFTTYLGQADGTFTQTSSYSPYAGVPESVQPGMQDGDPLTTSLVADLNGDGKPEEVAYQYPATGDPTSYAQILEGNGDGTFTPTWDIFPFYTGYPLYSHDLDGDGIADMVKLAGATASLQVMKGGRAPALQLEMEEPVVTGSSGCGWVFPDVASDSDRTAILSSSVTGVVLPASVDVPAGALSSRFCYTLNSSYDWHRVFDVNAQLDGDTATAYVSQSYVVGFSEALSAVTPGAIYSGQSTDPVTVTLTAAQGYSSTVTLSCQGMDPGDSCHFSSTTLNISSAGAATATLIFTTAQDAVSYGNVHPFTVIATDGNVTKRVRVNVTVSSLYVHVNFDPAPTGAPGSVITQFEVIGIAPFTFSCSGLPAGSTCSFSGQLFTYPASSLVTMTIAVPAGAALGTYPVQIVVDSGNQTASAATTLNVISMSLQGPGPSADWSLAGSFANVPIAVQGSQTIPGNSVQIACALDSGGSCSGGFATFNQSPQTVNLQVTISSGVPAGQHQLNVAATYGNLTQTASWPFYIADYGGSLSATAVTVSPGQPASVTATLNATTGFSSQVTLACAGVPQITCSFSPSTTQLTGGTSATVTIGIAASTNASMLPFSDPFSGRSAWLFSMLLPLGALGLKRRRSSRLLVLFVGLLVSSFLTSCGGGGGSTGGGGGGGSSTYSVTVTASAAGTTSTRKLGTVVVTLKH